VVSIAIVGGLVVFGIVKSAGRIGPYQRSPSATELRSSG
jgi:hypothetical protein